MITSLPTILAAGKVDALVEKFGLAWPKFFAQVIIFWIVFSILKKYAFGPILGMLEQRRQRIADGEAKLEKITKDAAEAAKNAQAILDKAEADAARLVKEADEASKALQERRQQDAVASANSILAKAREAAELEKEQLRSHSGKTPVKVPVDFIIVLMHLFCTHGCLQESSSSGSGQSRSSVSRVRCNSQKPAHQV